MRHTNNRSMRPALHEFAAEPLSDNHNHSNPYPRAVRRGSREANWAFGKGANRPSAAGWRAIAVCLAVTASSLTAAQIPASPPPPPGPLRVTSLPPSGITISGSTLAAQVASGATLPLWDYALVSPADNLPYSGTMVGRSPFYNGHKTTTIPVYIIAVSLTFSDGVVLDPTMPDACDLQSTAIDRITNSPLFQKTAFSMNGVDVGNTQFADAFQRASFWSPVAGTPHHTLLSVAGKLKLSLTVNGQTEDAKLHGGSCGRIGYPDVYAFIDWARQQIPLLAGQGVGATTLPIFVCRNVLWNGGIGGYHDGYSANSTVQTYAAISYDTSGAAAFFGGDVAIASHEIAEWLDDPLGNNGVPPWGHIGQQQGCQGNLEVGDPLTGILAPSVILNSFTYHLQEQAFFSWFYRQSPSIGAGGLYSSNGTFKTPAAACM